MGTAINLSAGADKVSSKKSIVRYLPAVGRVAMGLPLFVVGLNAFVPFIPQPTAPIAPAAAAFVGALAASGYMLQIIGGTQLIVGALLLSGRFVPLALALFAPFIVNSIAFHTVLEPSGLPFASIFLIIELGLVRHYWQAYRPMLAMRPPQASR